MSLGIDPVVQIAARVLLTLLFLGTAVHKMRDLRTTATITSSYLRSFSLPGSPVLATVVTAGLVAAELAAAGLCAFYPSGAAAAGLVAGLLGVYALGMSVSIARGIAPEDCGCSWAGTSAQPAGWALVLRNLVLIAVGLLLAPQAATRPLDVADYAGAFSLGLFAIAMYATADVLIANHGLLREGTS
ncbi:MAG: hypothetical protein OYL92_17355 [Acidobacteriota bacterium]|nr:hypothetical protein [Acidobacteriota bacterium]MDE3266736.1 hypothetical protein [Acidobacteriota bacterium]